jgi:hypothetical protein
MNKFILAAAIIAATTCTAIAREVCRNEPVLQVNCTTVNGKKTCSVSHETARVCHQEPDKPGKAAAAGLTDQVFQSDDETYSSPDKNSVQKTKQVLILQ